MSLKDNLQAIIGADRTLDELGIAKDEPVDVFAAIPMLGLELAIVPLDGLLGAMLPHGQGGILVTSQRNPRLQRYTAAHEIGHWVLHHVDPVMDTESEILHTTTAREREAQLFASYFLMPPPLIDGVLARYDLRGNQIQPEHIYLASRDMGVSYEAVAFRLYSAKMITHRQLDELRMVNRLDAMKRQFGRRPEDGHADLWQQDYAPQPHGMHVTEHDEIVIGLPENRASGWQWLDDAQLRRRLERRPRPRPRPPQDHTSPPAAVANPPDHDDGQREPQSVTTSGESVQVVSDTFVPAGVSTLGRARTRRLSADQRKVHTDLSAAQVNAGVDGGEPLIGGTGTRTVLLRGESPGETQVDLYYAHCYDPTIEPVLSYHLTVQVSPTPVTAYVTERIRGANLEQRMDGDPDDDATFVVRPR
jgi:Zn-dependent peptidase ImmA (M78 family)/predicted secreted protein